MNTKKTGNNPQYEAINPQTSCFLALTTPLLVFFRASTSKLWMVASYVWSFVKRAAIFFRTLLFNIWLVMSQLNCTHLQFSELGSRQPIPTSGHLRRGQFVGTWRCHRHLRYRNSMLGLHFWLHRFFGISPAHPLGVTVEPPKRWTVKAWGYGPRAGTPW